MMIGSVWIVHTAGCWLANWENLKRSRKNIKRGLAPGQAELKLSGRGAYDGFAKTLQYGGIQQVLTRRMGGPCMTCTRCSAGTETKRGKSHGSLGFDRRMLREPLRALAQVTSTKSFCYCFLRRRLPN